jgi:hypothetical protein
MKLKRNFTFLFLLAALLLVGSKAADACQKEAFAETTLEKYEKSKFVVIARGVSVEKVKEGEKVYSLFGVKAIKMVVEKSFKGNLTNGEEIVLVEGNGNDDVDSFRESDVGRKYLLFLCSRKQNPNVFQVLRGMNDWLADENAAELRYHENSAAEDLLYLEKLNELRGRTRIYGKIGTNQDSYSQMGKSAVKIFKNVKIRINGNGKTYETITNEDGVFEIYDLPSGKYSILPEIPKGWQISEGSSYGTSGGDNDLETDSQVELKLGRHAFYSYDLDANNTISGKVIDPTGNPMSGVCLEFLPIAGKSSDSFLTNDCTDKEGIFKFEQILGGDYLIVVNKDNIISSREPFPTVFYPNIFEREKAGIITVVEGENQSGITIMIPEVRETITVSGTLLSADGVPVVYARINFSAVETDKNIDGSAFALTDTEGRFSIKILKGLEGTLSGSVTVDQNQFKACPQIIKLINESGDVGWRDKKSNAVKIKTDKNFDNVELKLSFPSCNKTKIISRMRVD